MPRKSFRTTQEVINRIKTEPSEWEKVSANPVSGKGVTIQNATVRMGENICKSCIWEGGYHPKYAQSFYNGIETNKDQI